MCDESMDDSLDHTNVKRVGTITEYLDAVNGCKSDLPFGKNALFRGQGNADYKLESTLERKGFEWLSFKEYYEWIDYHIPEINMVARRFKRQMTDETPSLPFDFSDSNLVNEWRSIPNVELMAYLRHHGFPSPLLDVTRSEYVALYFACCDENEKCDAKVFVFDGDFDLGDPYCDREPHLKLIGPYFDPDPRHLRQQSEYLTCLKFEEELFFVGFRPYLKTKTEKEKRIREIVIQGDRKVGLLDELARMNITAYTLFGDEDGLIKEVGRKFCLEMGKKNSG